MPGSFTIRFTSLPVLLQALLCIYTGLEAQNTEIPVINKLLVPAKGIYRFSSFNDGSIVFRNGIISGARLNYNISFDEMHFISQHGDTLAVAAPATVNFINLNGSRFYYDKGFIQAIDDFNGIILGFKQVLILQQQSKEGYGSASLDGDATAFNFFTGNGQRYRLEENDEVKVSAKEYYFFADADGHFFKSNRDFVYQHFPKYQAAIKEFIKAKHINFNVLEDLLKLMSFCGQLK